MKPTSEEQPVVADNEGTPDEGTQSNGDDAPIVSTPVAAGLCAFLIAIGIALEVVWWYSNKHHGFASFPFTNLDPNEAKQFLKSFIPSLVLHPIVVLIGSIYLELHRIQPLTRNTSPYQSKDPIAILPLAISRRHWALAVASVVFLWSGVFHPLAGALFTVRPTSTNSTITVVSAGSIGFNDVAFGTPASFISAAGGTDALISTGNSLPSFAFKQNGGVTDGWTLAPFQPSSEESTDSEGTSFIFYETEAIHMEVQCKAANISSVTQGTSGAFAFTASLSSSCTTTFNGTVSTNFTSWQGLMAAADPSCINGINPNVSTPTSLPVENYPFIIGFSANRTAASAAFCYATQDVWNGLVAFDYGAKSIANITNLHQIQNHSIQGYAINGVEFPDSFAEGTIAQAVGLAVGDAILINAGKYNSSLGPGVNQQEQNQVIIAAGSDFISLVENALLVYLLSAAGRIFVQSTTVKGQALFEFQQARLFAYAPAVHTLAVLCIVSAFLFAFAFMWHGREVREFELSDHTDGTEKA